MRSGWGPEVSAVESADQSNLRSAVLAVIVLICRSGTVPCVLCRRCQPPLQHTQRCALQSPLGCQEPVVLGILVMLRWELNSMSSLRAVRYRKLALASSNRADEWVRSGDSLLDWMAFGAAIRRRAVWVGQTNDRTDATRPQRKAAAGLRSATACRSWPTASGCCWIKYLLRPRSGSFAHTRWSAPPESKGGTHDEIQTDWRRRCLFFCVGRTRDGPAGNPPWPEHLLRN